MLARGRILALLLIALASMSVSASAQSDSSAQFRRWAVGWDDGLGLRYRFNDMTGVGIMLHGNYSNSNYASSPRTTYASLGISVLLFRDLFESKPLALGPYVMAEYSHRVWHRKHLSEEFENGVTLGVGFRPTFTFWRRFVLETRFGVQANYLHLLGRDFNESGQTVYRTVTETWGMSAMGTNLGPGAVMQFMIYF